MDGGGTRWVGPLSVALAAVAVGLAMIWVTLYGEPAPRLRVQAPGTDASWYHAGVAPWVWVAGGLTTPLWVWSARRLPFDRRRGPLSVLFLVLLVLGVTLAVSTTFQLVLFERLTWPLGGFQVFLAWTLPLWIVVAVVHALDAQRRDRARTLEAAQLRAQLAESRVQALAAKLNPHFLFNTLQGISTLIHKRPEDADRMLGQLSQLLRESLNRGDRLFHSLADELQLLEHYVEIGKQRFGARLEFKRRIADDTLDARVPFFVLQPLVENAIEHGLARQPGPGRVTVSARRHAGELQLVVADDGPGLPADGAVEGIGLSNTRARLHELYGDRGKLELNKNGDVGLRAEVWIPYEAEQRG